MAATTGRLQRQYPARVTSHRRPGLIDVAAQAGVSYQTVSRVINNSGPVAARTRERVEAAIARLGYHPNDAARALKTGRGNAVVVFTSSTTHYGYANCLEGVEEAARAADLNVAIRVLPSEDEQEIERIVQAALSQPVYGAISLTHDPMGERAMDLIPARVPAVALGGSPHTSRSYATLDEEGGARAAVKYLLELGHETVHYIGPSSHHKSTTRAAGWRAELLAAGRAVPRRIPADWSVQSGARGGQTLLRRPGVTAVLCGNDQVAIGVIRVLTGAGRSVPGDVSVIGFDDEPIAAYVRPSLTTVRQEFVAVGRTAVELLRGEVEQGSIAPKAALSDTVLVRRESTGPAAPGQRTSRRRRNSTCAAPSASGDR